MAANSDNNSGYILGLDVGAVRIGVAIASQIAHIAEPLLTLSNGPEVYNEIEALCKQHDVRVVVAGLPRGLDGQQTAQTDYVEDFVNKLGQHVQLPVKWQDEAVTSRKAESELAQRGKPYAKGDIDALAATYILEDYLLEHPEGDIE